MSKSVNIHVKILITLFIAMIGYHIYLYSLEDHFGTANDLYGPISAIFYLYGALFGFYQFAKTGFKSSIGKAVMFLSLGGFAYAVALFIWGYAAFYVESELAYPSTPDYFYILLHPLTLLGIIFILKIYRVRMNLKTLLLAIVGIAIAGLITYNYLGEPNPIEMLKDATQSLGGAFDFAYVLGDWILVSIAMVTLLVVGGKLSTTLIFLIIFAASQGIGDFIFTSQIEAGTFWDGSIADFFFTVSGLFLSLAIIDTTRKFKTRTRPQEDLPSLNTNL